MSNYNWSIDDIKNKIKLIEEFEDKEKYRTDIITLNSMLNKTIEKRNITSSIEHELENNYELFQEWAKSFKQSVEKYNNNTANNNIYNMLFNNNTISKRYKRNTI